MDHSFRHIVVERAGDVFCVRLLQHQFDDHSVRAMSDEVESLILKDGCQKLIICLGPLHCLYSVLIARLIKLRRRVNEHKGALKLCDVPSDIMKVFESCQLHTYFDFAADAGTARASFGKI
jgi:anti-anti-sigma factor